MADTVNKIKEILTSAYSLQGYVELVNEIFPNIHFIAPNNYRDEMSNFSWHIAGSVHIGNYVTPDKKKIVIMAVELKRESDVDNHRSIHRSFAKRMIENANAEAAFIAFYTKDDSKWRLSFVRLEYEMRIEDGKLKAAENITPAKRYSYLVGKDEPCHTAMERFNKFIVDSQINPNHPTLEDLEEAFSVEKVTNEFFALYCEKFHQLREHLEENNDFCIEAMQHNFTSTQFAKKLMGQIVFLYFLQKKGWLGVKAWPKALTGKEYTKAFYACGAKSRELIPKIYMQVEDDKYKISGNALRCISDEDEAILALSVNGDPWGTGPHNFMRKLFAHAKNRGANFFDDYLEPLFYDALNVNRGEQGYCPALHCRIPFLSGGLFEPIDGYDWKHNDFAIPNEVFSNSDEKGRTADGILDIFDRYNFTMSEDEPLEREVAIDPEMLGKVFENLLEVQDRKSKGAFYTPREIVHYMCQESLINYLTNTINVEENAVREFILYGDFMKDEDTVKQKRQGNGGMYISDSLYKIDSSGKVVVNKLSELDKALADVRIADPAVGSGAFPVGMLNEIVRARQNISAYLAIAMNDYDKRMMYSIDRSPYVLKRNTIRNCIYAVDIEPSATDIAQLRLWLSLVIDDKINPQAQSDLDGHRNPLPLPNLEANILCGNSLIDEFEGKKLINESELISNVGFEQQISINQGRFDSALKQLISKQNELFSCDDTIKKHQIMLDIEALRDMIIKLNLEGCTPEQLQRYQESKSLASKPFILWQLDFAKVFREKGGFDIVIGNPPYIQLQKAVEEDSKVKFGDIYAKMKYETFAKTGDIYCLFYEKGWQLLHPNGTLTFITSNKWMRAGYGDKLRAFFAEKTNPLILIDFAGQKIFESATVDVNVLICTKAENKGQTFSCIAKEGCRDNLSVYVQQNGTEMKFESHDSWTILSPIEKSIKQKIESVGVPLKDWNISIYRGILTGYNEAFIISCAKKDELIAADPKSADIIRPILRGRDIKRYGYEYANLWLIATFPSRKYDIDSYPAVRDYLLKFNERRLEQTGKTYVENGIKFKARKKTSNKWFETQDSIAYWDDFSKPKIIWKRIGSKLRFCFDTSAKVCLDSTCFATGDDVAYLTAILNTNLGCYLLKDSPKTGTGDLIVSVQALSPAMVAKPTDEIRIECRDILDRIIHCVPDENIEELERRLDTLAYSIYNLNCEERMFVENYVKAFYR